MSKNHSVVVVKAGEATVQEVSVPKLRDDYLLVKVKAVALNPTDWKHVDFMTSKGARIGCDYAGIIEEIGIKVTKPFKKGDRVCGFVHGGNTVNHEDGSFQNYIVVKGDIQIVLPDNISFFFEEAATLGVGITTFGVGQGFYQSLQLPLPTESSITKRAVLIYGGSTATGALAIQYAVLSGLTVLTTCSPHNFAYVESLGATQAFDYSSPTCASDIKSYSNGSITHVFDCISESSSHKIAVAAMSDAGGVYSTLLPVSEYEVRAINPKVVTKTTLGYTVVGEFMTFGPDEIPAKLEDFEFGKMFWDLSRGLLEQWKIKVHKPVVNKYGKALRESLKAWMLCAMEKLVVRSWSSRLSRSEVGSERCEAIC